MYVNGELRSSTTVTWWDPGTYVYLAGGNSGNTKGTGYMDDVALFNRALSASEVLSIYNSDVPLK